MHRRESGIDSLTPSFAEKYVEALLAIYREPRIPTHLVSPLSWAVTRIDSEISLISSPGAIGAEVAVLANGDLHAGEAAIGLESWYLGNVSDDFENIRWERLDSVAEVFSNCMKPEECQRCDWRYRCGGLDPSVLLVSEASGQNLQSLFPLYCAPRKALFEEALWDSVDSAAAGKTKEPRERLELHPDGIDFKPVSITD